MKFDRTILLIIGVIIVLLLVAGIGYMTGAFGGTSATPTPTPMPSVTVTPTPTAQPTNVQTISPTAIPKVTLTATPMATPWNNGMGFTSINWNPTAKPTTTPTASPSSTASASPSASATATATATVTSTPTPTPTGSISVASTLDNVPTGSPVYSVSNGTGNNWGLTSLAYGMYTVNASLAGYDLQTQTVTVNSANVQVTFAFVTTTVNQVYDTAGIYTYTVPSNVTSINVTVIGGGGAGGSEAVFNGAGGGSGYVINSTIAVSQGQTFMVIVGSGGSPTEAYIGQMPGVTYVTGGSGFDGCPSYFILETTGSPIDIQALNGHGGGVGVANLILLGLGRNDCDGSLGGMGYLYPGSGTNGYGAGGNGGAGGSILNPIEGDSGTDGAVIITNS